MFLLKMSMVSIEQGLSMNGNLPDASIVNV
jgi:hypothetical protein